MDLSKIVGQIWSFAVIIVTRVWQFVSARPAYLALAAVLIFVADISLRRISESAEKRITVYVGPPASSSYRMSTRLADAVHNVRSTPGFSFSPAVVPTSGTTEIDEAVAHDVTGESIGVSFDRSQRASGLQMVAPLDWAYLHILVGVDFLARIRPLGKWPTQFSEVVDKIGYGRLYADGDSLPLASLLFDRYRRREGECIHDVLAPELSNWDQAAAALNAGKIDVAFYSGPLGATTVTDIAYRGKAVLLGLDDVVATMSHDSGLKLFAAKITQNSYRASPVQDRSWVRPPLFFCGRDIPTLAARRVIVTSAQMSCQDAYLICQELTKSLTKSDDMPVGSWHRETPDQVEPSKTEVAFGLAPHEGASMQTQGIQLARMWAPATWDATSRSVGLTIAALVATSLLGWLARWLKIPATVTPEMNADQTVAMRAPPIEEQNLEPSADATKTPFERLRARLESYLHQLKTVSAMSEQEHRQWTERIKRLTAAVRENRNQKQLTRKEAAVLLEAIAELKVDLALVDIPSSELVQVGSAKQ